jgi:phage baseplate assembly protein W
MAGRDPAVLAELLGLDLRLDYRSAPGFYEDADLRAQRSQAIGATDLAVVEGAAAMRQAIANRLKTWRGELAALGHPAYGSRHHELVGEPNVERTRNLIKLYVLQALKHEPRIERVLAAAVRAEHEPPRDTVRLELTVQIIGLPLPLEVIVPFSLAGGAS